jgi:signal transduction histidine kinase/ligand-binding sensor domain-containing protein
LPDNIVYAICEDKEQNLWIGSVNVICRYDGLQFKEFREEGSPGFRSYNQVFSDVENNLWAVSFDDQAFLRLVRILHDSIVPVSDHFTETTGNILNIFLASPGTIYITSASGLYEMSADTSLHLSILNNYADLKGRIIVPRSQDQKGGLLISSFIPGEPGQYFHHYRNGKLIRMEVPENAWFDNVNIMFPDSHERIWFGSAGNGLAVYDRGQDQYSYFKQSNGLENDFILGFAEDHEGNIWMGSRGGGMIKYSQKNFVSFNLENYIDDNLVRDIFQDSQGNIWFGLFAGGLVKYDGESFTAYSKMDFPGIHNVRGMKEIRPGVLMLASANGLFHFDGNTLKEVSSLYGLPGNLAYVDLYDGGDTIWLSTLNAGLARIVNGKGEVFSVQSGHLESNFFNGIFKDSRGDFWFCSNSGVGRYRNGSFNWYTVEDGISYPITLQATEDRLGRIWIATYMEGINIFDGQTFTTLTTEDGLNSNNIYSIIRDSRGYIWAGTSNGVNRILLDSAGDIREIQNYGYYDGFTGIENNGTAIFIDRDENIWFGTVAGAMRFDPHESKPNLSKPKVYISRIKLFFRDVDWSDEEYARFHAGTGPWFNLPSNLVFPHDSNHLSFHFEALSYQVPEKVRYQWKLDGLDKDWSPVTDNTEAVYSNIPPGEYTFMVRGMNNDGIWNEDPAMFSFQIKPPWWGSWYFILLVSLLGVGVITLIFKYRIRMIEAKKEELEKTVEEKTREVTLQNKQLARQKEEISAQAESLQTSYNNLEYLSEIGRIITSQLSVENIIDTVYESINKLMDATVFGIGIINREKKSIDFPGVKEKGKTLGFLSFNLEDELRLSSYCVKSGKEIFINDFEKEFTRYLPAITPAPEKSGNSESIIYLPLTLNEETIGVITVQSFAKNAYNDYHLNILRNLAVYTKIALENASAYRKIEEANKELVDLNKEKNHLIGIVAHDLRNPLTSSLTIAERLKSSREGKSDEEKESLHFLVNALHRMNNMVSKILDIRVIEQKKINMKCEKTDLGEVVHDVFRNMQETARQKNILLKLDNLRAFGMVDRNYLIQVFENLLSNAIKFSPENSKVEIIVEEENGEVRINFIDKGPGVKAEEMSRLFGKYQKLSARPTAGEDSTGLGLSIVKKYVDVMGGKVWCESEPGKGSNFIVSFRKMNVDEPS